MAYKNLILFFSFLSVTIITSAQITYESAFPNLDFRFPVEMQSAKDGTDRMFVVEQEGRIKVFPRNPNVTLGNLTTFLDITDRVSFANGQEIGLLGLAFHPDFTNNRYIYVFYTTQSPLSQISVRSVLSRFTVNSGNINLADPNSELIIFQFDKNQNNSNHNGGKIAFGPDGYLYVSFGDGGGGDDPNNNAQNTNNVFGSICRIDVDIDGSNPLETNPILPNGNYEIPTDNPFVGVSGLDEIYAYGIRNTWKFSFDEVNGTLWGADVGQGTFEEINIIEKGKNYGWKRFEGNIVRNNITISGLSDFPVFFYGHNAGDRSITGGYVYRGTEITSLSPDINSKYIFGDYVSGRVWALDYNATTGSASSTLLFKTNGQFISSFGVDDDGELYFSDYGINAKIYKLVDGTTTATGTAVNGIGAWSHLDEGVNGTIEAIATAPNGNVYHGGNFNQVGTITANNIAVWNKNNGWQTLGSGSNGTINALKISSNGDVYAGGSFSSIGGVSANNIAVWNGSTWSPVGAGINGPVAALEIDSNGNIYAGGVFETVNASITARNIALWNGSAWSVLTDATNSIPGTNNEIRSLAIDNNGILYVGGNFDEAGGNTAPRIATWDGANWGTLGSGTSGFVEAIATTDTDVYVAGNFAIAGGLTVNRIAKWSKTGNNWSTLGNGLSNIVNTLIHDGTNLYAAGAFDNANINATNSIIVHNIAQWNDISGWKALGTNTSVGVDIKINTMTFASDSDGVDRIFVGGNFNNAGAISANNTAQWSSPNLLSITELNKNENLYVYPNPTTGIVNLSKEQEWSLYNIHGKIIKTGKSNVLTVSSYPSGIYFLKIKNSSTLKIIKK
ncbi:PQQ-dependent sugar dehydrogenase [Litoribaculum gwangyangense]|uniref:T9SS C-terminal target domain-containing protein n=1 Tax=Litoribaculum gwangyangense TaxID=1130722 RepID=A0ABP9C485_9FLAO